MKLFNHAFQGPGGWYIENSLTTLNQKDPVTESNRDLWNSGVDSDKDIVRQRKLQFPPSYFNIYVVKDPANPQNEGVFLYRFGRKIFDKIMEARNLSSRTRLPLTPSTSGKVPTSN